MGSTESTQVSHPSSDDEEELNQNIYEVLSCDLQLYVLTFLYLTDLYHISLSCQHGADLVLSAKSDGYLWMLLASNLGINNNENSSVPQECRCMWRHIVRSNMIQWDPESRRPFTDLRMHNNNKTISYKRYGEWESILTNRKLEMGRVHCWEYSLDEYGTGNAYRIFVGIERSTFAFTTEGRDTIIGYFSKGVSYNVGEHSIHKEGSRTGRSVLQEKFLTGDRIAIKLDLKNLSSSKTASMYLFKNNEHFHTVRDIATQDIVYYPAISVIGRQRVSIRTRDPSTLRPSMWFGNHKIM